MIGSEHIIRRGSCLATGSQMIYSTAPFFYCTFLYSSNGNDNKKTSIEHAQRPCGGFTAPKKPDPSITGIVTYGTVVVCCPDYILPVTTVFGAPSCG